MDGTIFLYQNDPKTETKYIITGKDLIIEGRRLFLVFANILSNIITALCFLILHFQTVFASDPAQPCDLHKMILINSSFPK